MAWPATTSACPARDMPTANVAEVARPKETPKERRRTATNTGADHRMRESLPVGRRATRIPVPEATPARQAVLRRV